MNKRLAYLCFIWLGSLLSCSWLFWHFERTVNPNVQDFFDAVWWWIVTSTTVGYGDVYPYTTVGRIAAIAAIVIGLCVFASLVAILTEILHNLLEGRTRGTAKVNCRNHVVLCEYTAIADEIVQSLPDCPSLAGKPVVIVSDLVSKNPYPQHLFVCGVPINPAVLRMANVAEADCVFVFANLRFADPDIKTLHIASRVMEMNPRAILVVEMTNTRNELLDFTSRRLVVLDSREMMKAVLSGRHVNIEALFTPAK